MSNARSLHHPRDAWEIWREAIGHLYLAENRTCGYIKAFLISNHFPCSERQIKNRLRDWKLERKKTPSQHYLAMMSVANNERNAGYEIVFKVPKRWGMEHFNLKKIKKECDRVKKRFGRAHDDFSLPSLENARLVLRNAGITPFLGRPAPYPDISGAPGDYKRYSLGNPFATYTGWIVPSDDSVQVSGGDFERRSVCIFLENPPTCHSSPTAVQTSAIQVDNLCTIASGDDLASSLPMSVVVKNPPSPQWPLCEDNGMNWEPCILDDQPRSLAYPEPTTVLHDTLPTVALCPDRTSFVIALLDTRSGFTSLQCYDFKEEPMTNFEISRNQDIIMKEGNYNNLHANQYSKPVESGLFRRGIDIGPMDISHSSQDPKDFVNDITQDDDESRVVYGLLDGVGEWLLPTLIWMQVILASDGREKDLKQFLSNTCNTLEQAHYLENKDAFAVPFRYVWADLIRHSNGRIYWGQKLPFAQTQIINIQGFYHPNTFIIEHYTAWCDMYCGRLRKGVTTLKASLAVCEAYLGLDSIVTITRWVLISRGLEKQDNLDEALVYITKATKQLNGSRSDLAKYRFMILHRRGVIELQTNRLEEAEQHLLAALLGRFEVCGLEDNATWSSVSQYTHALVLTGRVDTATEVSDYFTRRLNWERNLEWTIGHQEDLDIPDPPSWMSAEFHSKAAKLASTKLALGYCVIDGP
ncbi:hypothetical protein LTS17_002997 [Exophiala oligosperma]